ncbi:flagellar motor switch protein FliG [Gilvimarinus agarilyticus]|uniref:flagellar motor switch protein FliG n=1 Tax=unclassified Gilvimarinus TaxID=2642066 RepID=UPI001C09CC16|nr:MULTISPECIES: flagellar motor switch protein FliG [unclassified Gilvimarinus]MBU2887237.1 flagellar motor switch protein FliG [Gilvimarinus agarilyticus]MDO6571896.1 flagellar motor switch protein FliG [Gilvimarinus sp. 2_MG-2023]MDO6745965.1 flagellar motor switch protein FliG [Gilvimarinus sp. 1_MG-2023]
MAEKKDDTPQVTKLDKVDQAAILLMSLGEQDAAEVLKHMGPKEVQRIGSAMSSLQNVQQSDVQVVMQSFLEEARNLTGLGMGADNYIRNMLVTALGEDKASSLVDRILLGGNTTGLDTLKWMEARSIADIIRNEHPQIQAIVIAYLDADQSAEVLSHFTEKVRIDIMMRVASLDTVQPSALQELNDILEKQFSGKAGSQTKSMGGYKVAAEIMNNLDGGIEAELMDAIKEVDEDMGNQIQDLMFVFDNLKDVDDRGIQMLLREVSSEVLIVALKGAENELQEKIFKNMSKRAAELLRDDLEVKGPVRVSEVESAQKEILTIARRMADAGEIVLGGSGEQML